MSGVDYMRTHVVVDVAGVFNPVSTASFTQPGTQPGVFGDRAGVSLAQLRQALLTPRRQLLFFIGPDLVFSAPSPALVDPAVVAAVDAATAAAAAAAIAAGAGVAGAGANASQSGAIAGAAAAHAAPGVEAAAFAAGLTASNNAILAGQDLTGVINAVNNAIIASISESVPPDSVEGSDVNWGPKPLACNIREIVGDKSVVVQWRGEFWVMGTSNIVLSNRWVVSHQISSGGMTTRTQRGRCVIRADAITQGTVNNADDFRAALILPQEFGFRRDVIDVTISADGTEALYMVRDVETPLALGTDSPAYKIEGYATAGFDCKIKDFKDAASEVSTLANNAVAGNFAKIVTQIADAVLPVAKGRAMCRVTGGRNASRAALAQMALNVCLDRALNPILEVQIPFNPFAASLLTSVYITQDIASDAGQVIECRAEWFPNLINPHQLASAYDATAFQNLSNDYNSASMVDVNGNPAPLMNSVPGPNPQLHNYVGMDFSGTRGSYVGAMMVQAIAGPSNLPPPTPQVVPAAPVSAIR